METQVQWRRGWHLLVAGSWLACCGGPLDAEVGVRQQAVVYDRDGRQEFYEVLGPATAQVFSESVVTLIARSQLSQGLDALHPEVRTLGEVREFCDGVAFASQPSAAFCSGVLVDEDLVLTAGHCADAMAPSAMVAVFGYYFTGPSKIGFRIEDVVGVQGVITSRRDPKTSVPRHDYAWLRLDGPAPPQRRPALLATGPPFVAVGDRLQVIGSAAGTPAKLTTGGQVRELREAMDFFVADTDTSRGASGAPAFDSALRLHGILARGEDDYVATEAGCYRESQLSVEDAGEEYTHVTAALEGLCEDPLASVVCRPDCSPDCRASALAPVTPHGCSLVAVAGLRRSSPWSCALLALICLSWGLGAVRRNARTLRRTV